MVHSHVTRYGLPLLLSILLAYAGSAFGLTVPYQYKKSYDVPGHKRDFVQLGDTYSYANDEFKNFKCFNFQKTSAINTVQTLETENNADYEFITDVLTGGIDVGFRSGISVKGGAEIAKRFSKTQYSETLFSYKNVNWKQSIKPETLSTTPVCNDIINLSGKNKFDIMGSHYVYQLDYTASLLFSVSLVAYNSNLYDKISGTLQVSGGGGAFEIEGNLEHLSEEEKNHVKVQLRAEQIGGEPIELLGVLDAGFLECSVGNLSPCLSAYVKLHNYAAHNFPSQFPAQADDTGYQNYAISKITLWPLYNENSDWFTNSVSPILFSNYERALNKVDDLINENVVFKNSLDALILNYSYVLNEKQREINKKLSAYVSRNLMILDYVSKQCYLNSDETNQNKTCWRKLSDLELESGDPLPDYPFYEISEENAKIVPVSLMRDELDRESLTTKIDNFSAKQARVEIGQYIEMHWNSTSATSCTMTLPSQGKHSVPLSGTKKIGWAPYYHGKFKAILECKGFGVTKKKELNLEFIPVEVNVTADQTHNTQHDRATLTWRSKSATSCKLYTPATHWQNIPLNGSKKLDWVPYINGSFSAKIVCKGRAGTGSATATQLIYNY